MARPQEARTRADTSGLLRCRGCRSTCTLLLTPGVESCVAETKRTTNQQQQAKNQPWYVNSSRVHLRRQVRKFSRGTQPGMVVLDAGAGRSPYRRFFKHAQYESADFAKLSTRYAPLDYVCDMTDIPVEDGRFDRVLFNQVLEHLPEPGLALQELNRVLKPGGRIFCSAPLFFPAAPGPVRLLPVHPVRTEEALRRRGLRDRSHRVARRLLRHHCLSSSATCTPTCPPTLHRCAPSARAGASCTWRRYLHHKGARALLRGAFAERMSGGRSHGLECRRTTWS